MSELPIAPIKRLLKNAGASRISEDAAIKLADVLEEITFLFNTLWFSSSKIKNLFLNTYLYI